MLTVSCRQCGTSFDAQRSTARFCSDACRSRSNRAPQTVKHGEDNRFLIGEVCWAPGCDTALGSSGHSHKRFCCNACRQRYYRSARARLIDAAPPPELEWAVVVMQLRGPNGKRYQKPDPSGALRARHGDREYWLRPCSSGWRLLIFDSTGYLGAANYPSLQAAKAGPSS